MTKRRYWVSWYSHFYESYGHRSVSFPFWISGETMDEDENGVNRVTIVGLVEVESEETIWQHVGECMPDYEVRFCEERDSNWFPGDRFPIDRHYPNWKETITLD